MYPEVSKISKFPGKTSTIFLSSSPVSLPAGFFSKEEISYISRRNKKEKQEFFSFNR
jgi:hypothetical protein